MKKRCFALLLAAALLVSLLPISAAAAVTYTEVSSASAFVKAMWSTAAVNKSTQSFTLGAPVHIRLTKDVSLNYSTDNIQDNGSPFAKDNSNAQSMYVPAGSEIDLNGHTLTLRNVRIYWGEGSAEISDQSASLFRNGKIITATGNNTNTRWALRAQSGILGGLLTDCYTTSNNAFSASVQTTFRVPENVRMHLQSDKSSSVIEYASTTVAHTLVLSSGATVDGSGDFHTMNPEAKVILEAANAADLAKSRISSPHVDQIMLTADISAPSLKVELPAGVVLDYHGHTLNCATVSGETTDSTLPPPFDAEAKIVAPAGKEIRYLLYGLYNDAGRMTKTYSAENVESITLPDWNEGTVRVYAAGADFKPVCDPVTLQKSVETVASSGLQFTSNDDTTCTVTGLGTCTDATLVIPARSPSGDLVTAVAAGALAGSKAAAIVVPDTVELESGALDGCDSIFAVVSLPTAVKSVPYTREELEQIVVETALAYHSHMPYVQYDSASVVTTKAGSGYRISRSTSYMAPEDAEFDSLDYSVCSNYMFQIYWNAFGYAIGGSPSGCGTSAVTRIAVDNPMTVVKYGDEDGMTDREAALRLARESLRPGDLIVGYGIGTDPSGHAMMYIGDALGDGTEYAIHCWGASYDTDTGKDKWETKEWGSLYIQDVDALCFKAKPSGSKDPNWDLGSDKCGGRFIILRPLNDIEAIGMLPNASGRTRLQYPGMVIHREVENVSVHSDIPANGQVTVKVTVQNTSKAAYQSVNVRETVPTGCTLVAGTALAGAAIEGGSLRWTLDIPAGQTVTLTYDVKLTAYQPGDAVVFPAGQVGGIPNRKMTFSVSASQLTDAQIANLLYVGAGSNPRPTTGKIGLLAVNDIYKKLTGIDPGLPSSARTLYHALTEEKKLNGYELRRLLDTPQSGYEQFRKMMPVRSYGGLDLFIDASDPNGMDPLDRLLEIHEENFQPGDIILRFGADSGKDLYYIYLGGGQLKDNLLTGGKVMKITDSGAVSVEDFAKSSGDCLANAIVCNAFITLRPTLVLPNP